MSKRAEPKPPLNIIQACEDEDIFAPWFKDRETWAAWFAFLKVMFGLQIDDAELATFQKCTARSAPAPGGYLEATLVIGRRGGKSLVLALIAAFLAAFYDWSPYLTGGERGTIMVVAADRKQARAIFRYLKEMLSIPLLAGMIERETADSVDLSNNITVEIMAANFKTIRSYTLVAGLADELAFWPTDEGLANPDSEIIGAIRPAMATIPKAMLLKASSPYAKRGELWEDHKRYFGQDTAKTLVWQAETRAMNPTVRRRRLQVHGKMLPHSLRRPVVLLVQRPRPRRAPLCRRLQAAVVVAAAGTSLASWRAAVAVAVRISVAPRCRFPAAVICVSGALALRRPA
jgi:hypothetical protein